MTKFESFCRDAGVPTEKVLELARKHLEESNEVIPAYLTAKKAIPADLTAADLERVAKHADFAFAVMLYGIAGNDPERDDILMAQRLAVGIFKQLAAERKKRGLFYTCLHFLRARRRGERK